MSGMNSWLASIYGTGADVDDNIEKTAQAHLLAKLAEESNIDISQFTPEELQALAAEIMGENAQGLQAGPPAGTPGAFAPAAQLPQQAAPQAFAPAAQQAQQAQQGQPGQQGQGGQLPFQMAAANQQAAGGGMDPASLQKEAQAKWEEADFLGRVMAHAYTQELEKIAGSRFEGAKSALKGAAGAAKGKAQHFGGVAKAHVSAGSSSPVRKGVEHAKRHKGAYGAGAAAAGGFAAGRMSKEASAFEKLAEMQAAEILGATGFDPSTGTDLLSQGNDQGQQQQQFGQDLAGQQQQVNNQQMQQQVNAQTGQTGQEQVPGQEGEQDFQQALNDRSLEMLEQAGYDVNEILARLQYAQQQGGQGQA